MTQHISKDINRLVDKHIILSFLNLNYLDNEEAEEEIGQQQTRARDSCLPSHATTWIVKANYRAHSKILMPTLRVNLLLGHRTVQAHHEVSSKKTIRQSAPNEEYHEGKT